MQKSKAIKETIETIIVNLEKERDHIQKMVDDIDMRIKKNKEAGNVAELSNLSSAEKIQVEKFIKDNIEEDTQNIEKGYTPTTAKKLMPKMKDKV